MEQTHIKVPRATHQAPLSHEQVIGEALVCAFCLDQQADGRAGERPGGAMTEKEIRSILKLRRQRDQFLGAGLFADPAWDILLELYAAELSQRRVSISHVCVSASVPATTALRWINLLESRDLVRRKPDPFDARRVFLSLSGPAIVAIENYFAAAHARPQLC